MCAFDSTAVQACSYYEESINHSALFLETKPERIGTRFLVQANELRLYPRLFRSEGYKWRVTNPV